MFLDDDIAMYLTHNGGKSGVAEIFIRTLKLVSSIFYQIFIFSPNESPSKTMKRIFYFI